MNAEAYEFDARIERAETPPASWYTDARFHEEERRRVFGRTWQLAGRADRAAEPGQFFTAQVGGEPVVVVRDAAGVLRAFSNVCRHRAGPVAAGEGRCRSFRCGYHGWTYALDGRLVGAREFDGVEGWSRDEVSLPRFAAEQWGALVFVNLDAGAAPLAETLEDIPALTAGRDWASMRPAARREWAVECNWKTYVDNYLEGYHIPVVHPALHRELDYARYRTETRRFYSLQHAPLRPAATRIPPPEDGEPGALYFWVFPNMMLNVYADNYSTNLIVPLGPERTLTVFEWYFRDPESAETRERVERTVGLSDEVQVEDVRVCEAVQTGLRSRTYARGRYCVRRENGVHHFHGLLAEFMSRA
ncbi:MAG: Rieske 2Fe-2S domain-containing protein [Acidobacteria bacterium]|nr:Rieske 2Fe-2S domain-containing protein [Acidobacteriota bacterium]